MQVGCAALSRHQYAVPASIILERDMKGLMDVAYPMSEELQRR
jgi:hypothetical protein